MKRTHPPEPPDFSAIGPALIDLAKEAWKERDAFGLMILLPHQKRGRFLFENTCALLDAGMYEEALFEASIHGPYLHRKDWRYLFEIADKGRLSQVGDPVPSKPIKVYRGVVDVRRRIFIRGLSWTTNPNTAAWFATWRTYPGAVPGVYALWVKPEEILFMTNERSEEEVVVAAWMCGKMKRLVRMPESIQSGSDDFQNDERDAAIVVEVAQ